MQKLTLICAILLTSGIAYAEDTTTETCANGGGTVIEGAVADTNGNKHKYCLSKINMNMNWWNAYSWCDGQGRRLFNLTDCKNGVTSYSGKCLELQGMGLPTGYYTWVATPKSSTHAYFIYPNGSIGNGERSNLSNGYNDLALCY
ncbi:MAG: hypothetical protein IKL32_02300 [Alphaproteobacteria bacterium]|nr:hypothetical protein [Alphaproteobacteria bacterium]